MRNERLRLELRRARRPFAVYVVALAVASAVLAIMVTSQRFDSPFADTYRFRAVVDDVKGVVPGKNPVRIAGVEVGLITAAELDRGRPVVEVSIKREYAPVFRDAHVRVRPLTAVQDMFAVLERGTRSAGRLPEGGLIGAEQTVSAVDISRVLQTFDAPTRSRLHALLVGFGQGLDDRGAALRQAFVELGPFLDAVRRLSHELAVRRRVVARGVNRLSELTGALAARDRRLAALVRDAGATFGSVGARAAALERTVRALPVTAARLDGAMGALLAAQRDLDPALERLRPTVGSLEPAVEAIDRLSRQALPALRDLRGAAGDLRPLVADLRPAAMGLRDATQRLAPQAPSLDRLTAFIPGCQDELRKYMALGASVGKFGTPQGGAFVRFEPSIGFDLLGSRANFRRMPSCTEEAG